MDAQLSPAVVKSGDFDLAGMIAMLGAKKKEIGGRWIVFDGIDVLLDGGVFRGSSTLISGLPGTAKTPFGGKFAEAACGRGERTLFVSYDEGAEQIERNLLSVGINLAVYRESGLLRMFPARTEATSAEELLARLKVEIREFRPRCIVIDPLTAIGKASEPATARSVASRFMYLGSSPVPGDGGRAQPGADYHQVAWHSSLKPGPGAPVE